MGNQTEIVGKFYLLKIRKSYFNFYLMGECEKFDGSFI